MAGFKDSEIESAVSGYVQSKIRIEKSSLGPVSVASKFEEVTKLISSTLTYDPNAIFYVIFLATNKLNAEVETAIGYVEDVAQAIEEMGKTTADITRTTLLGDAAAALLTVDEVLTSSSVISGQAYNRYLASVDKFITASLAPNIRSGGQIVRPPQLARAESLSALSVLQDAYEALLAKVDQIQQMLSEFTALDLGVVAVQNSVRTIRNDLTSLQTFFESTDNTRDDKIALARDAYLSLASGKAVLNNYTTVTDPSDPRLVSSSSISGAVATPVGDDGVFSEASVINTKSGPWAIVSSTSDELKLAEDGAAETTYTLVPPSQPSITSLKDDNWDTYRTEESPPGTPVAFNIVTGVNDKLQIDGLPDVSLTVGANRTAAQIASDINTWAVGGPYPYVAAVVVSGGLNYVKITKSQTGATQLEMTAEGANQTIIRAAYDEIGFYEGQADSSSGISAAELAALINAVGKVTAKVVRTEYEAGTAGEVISTTQMDVALGTFASLSHAEDMLVIRSGLNAGYHRVVSITQVGLSDRVTVSSDTPFKVLGTDQDWLLQSELVQITSKKTDLTTALVIGSGNANTVLGFSAGTVVGTTTGFRAVSSGADVDFSRYDVVVGDVVRVVDSTPVETVHEVLEVSDDGMQLELDPPLATDLSVQSFRIYSKAAVDYAAFITAIESWGDLKDASNYRSDISELERVMNPLLSNKNPSLAQINDARNEAAALLALLTNASPSGLSEVLKSFVVTKVPRIDAALKMLKERGLDRAFDTLMDGNVEEFFSMDKDDASTGAFMLKSMRSVVQEDLPQSKLEEDADDTAFDYASDETDADFDFSDADTDENIELLGDVPDFDDPNDASLVRGVRY